MKTTQPFMSKALYVTNNDSEQQAVVRIYRTPFSRHFKYLLVL